MYINMQIKGKHVFCMISFQRAVFFAKENLDANGKPLIKITKPSFRHKFLEHFYERASPFVDPIEKAIQQVVESGIRLMQQSRTKIIGSNEYVETSRLSEDILSRQLIIIVLNKCLLVHAKLIMLLLFVTLHILLIVSAQPF